MLKSEKSLTIVARQKLKNINHFLSLHDEGLVVEVGVFRGGFLSLMAKQKPKMKFLGFDTFEGLPPVGEHDNYCAEGMFSCSLENVQRNLREFNNITLVKGIFPDSAKDMKLSPILLAHIDVDLYDSTLQSFDHLIPQMAKGGRIYCDDAFVKNCEGATIAVCEIASKYKKPLRLERGNHAFFSFE